MILGDEVLGEWVLAKGKGYSHAVAGVIGSDFAICWRTAMKNLIWPGVACCRRL
jgi:hypothetical protein